MKVEFIYEFDELPERCKDCHAFYLTPYQCHNECGDEAHCALGCMNGHDMRDFNGDIRFKHCKLPTMIPKKEHNVSIEQAIELLKHEYERAKEMPYVKKPLAWSIFQVWREIDAKERERK